MSGPRDLRESLEGHTEVETRPPSVDHRRRPDQLTASFRRHAHRLPRRTAGGDDILDDEHPIVGLERKPSPQRQPPITPLGKQPTYAKSPSDFVTDHDTTERRGHDDSRLQAPSPIGDRRTKNCRPVWMLEHEGALEIAGTV